MDFAKVEERIGYIFRDKTLLQIALTHPSMRTDRKAAVSYNYQRLEFLGDSLLGFVISDILYEKYPKVSEGELAKYKSILCQNQTLSELAENMGLGECLIISDSVNEYSNVLEDIFEAIIGAIYRDGGYEVARIFILDSFADWDALIVDKSKFLNPKGKLQEHYQTMNPFPRLQYELLKVTGPDHAKRFEVELYVDGLKMGTGHGNSKKRAEEMAALSVLENLQS